MQGTTICHGIGKWAFTLWIIGNGIFPAQAVLPSRTNDNPSFTFTPSPSDWRDFAIYQVFTDRFCDGDPDNNAANGNFGASGEQTVHGGDFAGIKAKLNYIKMLGMSAIWISPVNRNRPGTPHGYWPDDFGQIDPHWGSLADLRELVDAAHGCGIRIFIDVIANEMADLIDSSGPGFPAFKYPESYTPKWKNGVGDQFPPPFNDLNLFYMHGTIANWSDNNQVLYGDFPLTDSLNTERADVRSYLRGFFCDLIAATDCDGFRMDTAKLVELNSWKDMMPGVLRFAHSLGKTNFLILCEAATADASEVGTYTQPYSHPTYGIWPPFNSALNFPYADTFEKVFFYGHPTSELTYQHSADSGQALSYYSSAARYSLGNFFDNHDRSRALSSGKLNGNQERLKTALGFHLATLQMPILYYGTEQGFNGETDPYDREDMFDGEFEKGPSLGNNFNYTHPLFLYIRKLMLIKNAYPQLRQGGFTQRWQDFDSQGLYIFSRDYNALGEVIVAVNTASSAEWVTGAETTYSYGTELANLLDENERILVGHNVDANHKIRFSVPAFGVKIWFKSTYLQKLPPSIVAQTPAHGSTGVSCAAPITLTFDRPMNSASVESALSISSAVAGTFNWQSNNTVVSFVPASNLSATTIWTVTVAASATASNGLSLGAGFASFFQTGMQAGDMKMAAGSPAISQSLGQQNVPGENFDLERSGDCLSTTDQGGFGSLGQVYINYDTNGLYVGAMGVNIASSNNGMILFLGLNTRSDDKMNLWNNSGQPNALDFLHNLAFTSPMDMALVLGDEWGDATSPSFNLQDGYDFGQGIYYLGSSGFLAVPGARLAQFDGTAIIPVAGTDDDGNRQVERWEAYIPWSSLDASGMHNVSNLTLAGVLASSSVQGSDRYLSGNVLASQQSGTLTTDNNYAFNFLMLTPVEINLSQVDSDGDSMPDQYERDHGLNPDGAADKNGDLDGDSFLNWEEFAAGTDIGSSNSFLWVEGGRSVVASQPVVQWPSVTGKVYHLQRATQLLPADFAVLATNIPATPPMNMYTDLVSQITNFYRVGISP